MLVVITKAQQLFVMRKSKTSKPPKIKFELTENQFEKTLYVVFSKAMKDHFKNSALNQTSDGDENLSMEQVEKMLRRKHSTLLSYNCRREIPFFKNGKDPIYKKSDVIAYMERNKIKSKKQILADVNNINSSEIVKQKK